MKILLVYVWILLMFFVSCSDLDRDNPSGLIAAWRDGSSKSSSSEGGSLSSSSGVNSSSSSLSILIETFTDSRDNHEYKKVVIGTQIWMAENLNYQPATGYSWCYGNETTNCDVYGRLYDWAAAITSCPTDWHLPDTTEWNTLIQYVGGASNAGTKLKSNSSLWTLNSGTNVYGFSALPGGRFNGSDYEDLNHTGYLGLSTTGGNSYAYFGSMVDDSTKSYLGFDYRQSYGFSVRCIHDSTITLNSSSSSFVLDSITDPRDSQNYTTVKVGTLTWMAENLNYQPASGNSWCYNNETTNCGVYGRLYDWATAQIACPSGWHLPDTTEWNALEASVGGASIAGKKLKANSPKWITNTGTDSISFAALPGGYYAESNSNNLGNAAYWWTNTSIGSSLYTYSRHMNEFSDELAHTDHLQTHGFSVRCVLTND